MEIEINFLEKPKINIQKLDYIEKKPIDIYVNLYEIFINKELKLFQYPFSLNPEPKVDYDKNLNLLVKNCNREMKSIFKNCFISGKSLYSNQEIKEVKNIKSYVYIKKKEKNLFLNFKNVQI